MPNTVYLIDGHAEVFRSHYAMEGLSAPDGRPSGAIFGFARTIMDVRAEFAPECLAVVFDPPGPSFRKDRYPEYKATRKPTPEPIVEQLPYIKNLVRALSIPVFEMAGFEADDVLGTLARRAVEAGLDVVLVGADKDLAQLLNDRVRFYMPRKKTFTTREDFEAAKGIPPERLPDAMALWGDASDNIPGVPGIGEKGALALIKEHGSLENLLAHADTISGKRGEAIRANVDNARLSKWLATIKTDIDLPFDAAALVPGTPDIAAANAICDQYGLNQLKAALAAKAATAAHSGGSAQAPVAVTETRDYALVNTPELFDTFFARLSDQTHIAFDVETTSTDPMRAELVGMSFSWAPRTGWYLPFKGPRGENLFDTAAQVLGPAELERVRTVLENERVTKTGHNIKYDALVMRRHGVELRGIVFDSMIASHILNGHIRGHSLDACAERHLHVATIHIEELIGTGKNQITMDQVELPKIAEYAAEDADIALRLEAAMRPALAERDSLGLLNDVEMPLLRILIDMQYTGVRLDTARLADMSRLLADELEKVTAEIHERAGTTFNIASPKQLAEVLFEKMNFPVIRKTKTGISTDEDVLEELSQLDHVNAAFPAAVLRHRSLSKLKSTYVDALPDMVNPATGRVHTTFHQTGTQTGRLSSSDPNLQNIPIRTELGRAIRGAFVTDAGWTLVSADYSQIELRMLAHFSQDLSMQQAFRAGADIHRAVAALIHDVEEDEVTPEQRSAAKAINFGIVYGQGAYGLSQSTGMSQTEAKHFIGAYFAAYPGVRRFIDESIAEAARVGYVQTILGRRREIPDIRATNKMKRSGAERMAVNTIVQGSAADLIKLAMIRLSGRLARDGAAARMLLQIHDELVLECPVDDTARTVAAVREEMEGAMALSVPRLVQTATGNTWLDAK